MITVKPQFAGPLGGKEFGTVNRGAIYMDLHIKFYFLGTELRPGKLRDMVNRGFTV